MGNSSFDFAQDLRFASACAFNRAKATGFGREQKIKDQNAKSKITEQNVKLKESEDSRLRTQDSRHKEN